VLRQEHRPGEKLFVDWAGGTIPVYDPATGEAHPAQLFVAVLDASNYTSAEAAMDQRMASWIGGHVRCFEFLGGCPQLVVPDNTRTGVSKACRYEPDLNPTCQEMALHYVVGVLPTRPRNPGDKANPTSAGLGIQARQGMGSKRPGGRGDGQGGYSTIQSLCRSPFRLGCCRTDFSIAIHLARVSLARRGLAFCSR